MRCHTLLAACLLALLSPAPRAGGKTPDVSDTHFAPAGTLVVSIKGVGKHKESHDYDFLYGVSDFEIDNALGLGFSGFLDEDFSPPRLEPDDTGAEDWFGPTLVAAAAAEGSTISVQSATFTSGKGKVRVKPGKGNLVLAFSLVMTFDLELTVDGVAVSTTGKAQLKGKGSRPFFMAETSWDVPVKYRARLSKVGVLAEPDSINLQFNPDNTFDAFDPLGGPISGTWVYNQNGVLSMLLDTSDFEFFMIDVVSEVESEAFVFLDNLQVDLVSAVIKAKVKPGVSLRYSLVIKFNASALLDGETPIESKGVYTVKGKGCLDI